MSVNQPIQSREVRRPTTGTLGAPMSKRPWSSRLSEIIAAFSGKRILVLGDLIADEYRIGQVARISREAPIPVVNQREHFIVPGGALNPAVNARTLGAEVHVAGLIGDDQAGQKLRQRLSELGIYQDLLFSEPGRPTNAKLRILASNGQAPAQHMARIDTIDNSPPEHETVQHLINGLHILFPHLDGVILSDYDNGLMVLPLVEAAMRLARRHDTVLVADAHENLGRFQHATAITPNLQEAEMAAGMVIQDSTSLEVAGRRLLAETNVQSVLITRGGDGMSVFERSMATTHIPAYPSEVRDTTGAGDTVAATFTLALATGATLPDAAALANVAAALVVRRLGCATTSPDELLHAVASLEIAW